MAQRSADHAKARYERRLQRSGGQRHRFEAIDGVALDAWVDGLQDAHACLSRGMLVRYSLAAPPRPHVTSLPASIVRSRSRVRSGSPSRALPGVVSPILAHDQRDERTAGARHSKPQQPDVEQVGAVDEAFGD
jgi:hypothetical protein